MPLHEARQISIELHLKRLWLRWSFCEGYSDWRGNGFGRREDPGRGWGAAMRLASTYIWLALAVVIAHWANLGIWGRNAGCWFCLCGDDPKVSNGYVVQAYYWKGNRMNSQRIPILNIFNFPPVLKQITLYRKGATNPHPLWGDLLKYSLTKNIGHIMMFSKSSCIDRLIYQIIWTNYELFIHNFIILINIYLHIVWANYDWTIHN